MNDLRCDDKYNKRNVSNSIAQVFFCFIVRFFVLTDSQINSL